MVSKFITDLIQYKEKMFERLDKSFYIIDEFLARKYTNDIKNALRNYETTSMIILYEDDINELKSLIEKEFPDIPVVGDELEMLIVDYSSKINNVISLPYDDDLYVPGEQMVLYIDLNRR